MVASPVITIDGPSGSGKGTLSKALASQLNWSILDSGAMYRALALVALQQKIIFSNENQLANLAARLDIRFMVNLNKSSILLYGKEIQKDISSESIGDLASSIAIFPKVREVLLYRQRLFQLPPGLIADGRDMGTVVFPKAILKFFLDASYEERVKRRTLQLQKKGFNVNLNKLLENMKKRDDRDSNRVMSPLIPAVDALVFNSTGLSTGELKSMFLMHIRRVLIL